MELQLRVEEPPEDTLVGLALNVTEGAAPLTATVADCGAHWCHPIRVSG